MVLNLNNIQVCNIFVSSGNNKCLNVSLKLVVFRFIVVYKYWIIPFLFYFYFTTSLIWSGVGGFFEGIISLLPIACMCLIWLKLYLFSFRFIFSIILPLWNLMMWTLLYLPGSCWVDIASMNFFTVVDYFYQLWYSKHFLFLACNALFHVLMLFEW